jgi:hypothetical protein
MLPSTEGLCSLKLFSLFVCWLVGCLVNFPVCLSDNESVSQSVSQSVSLFVCMSVFLVASDGSSQDDMVLKINCVVKRY